MLSDSFNSEHLFCEYITKHVMKTKDEKGKLLDVTIVSPDAGGVKRAKSCADTLHLPMVIIHKERKEANVVGQMILVGDVTGKVAVIVDDMADTCGTLCKAAKALKENGAAKIFAAICHGVLSGPALKRLENSVIEECIVCDTICQVKKVEQCSKLKVVSVASLFGEAIRRVHNGESVAQLFDHSLDE